MIKHKLPAELADRFLTHRKNSLISLPIYSQIYHATYRNFPLVVRKEVRKITHLFRPLGLPPRLKLKFISLFLLSTALLPQDINIQAKEPVIMKTNRQIVLSADLYPDTTTISQEVTTAEFVEKPIVKTPAKKATTTPIVLNDNFNPTVSDVGFNRPILGYVSTRFSLFHRGVDIVQPSGTPIHPIAAGIIVKVGYETGFGNTIIIDHGNGYKSRYAHLSKFQAKTGDKVDQSTVIGFVGATGWATGNHLHLEIYKNGPAIDPIKVLPI